MIQRALCAIAGVDRATLLECPPSDKLWATHLGFSLILSFVVVFGISYHATSYVIENSVMRLATALVIALTVFMFDRALYQSDWFSQGMWRGSEGHSELVKSLSPSFWRFLRIFVRLAISFALAWIIALFLELAIFSDTITDQIKRDHVKANQPIYQKLDRYERSLDEDIAARRRNLAALESLNTESMSAPILLSRATPGVAEQYEQQLLALDRQEENIRASMRDLDAEITRYAEEMNAEERGQKLRPTQSGRAGIGPRYQFAKQQRELFVEQRTERAKELSAIQRRRDEVRSSEASLRADGLARETQERQAVERKRQNLQSQVDVARNELQEREASRTEKIEAFTKAALASSEFQKQKNDPLSRMTAYQELHNDPKDGATITLFSWMTKVLVIFLEIVPVVAKIFFSPPSVYGALIQARVARERAKIRREHMQAISQYEITEGPEVPREERTMETPEVGMQIVPKNWEQPTPDLRPKLTIEKTLTGLRHKAADRLDQTEVKTAFASKAQEAGGDWNLPKPTPPDQQTRAWSELPELPGEASQSQAPLTLADQADSPAVTKPWAEALHTIINKSRSRSPDPMAPAVGDQSVPPKRRPKELASKAETIRK
jgi:hypothetical protein